MSFRDLRKFNTALLAKQVWRLLHEKNSLFYKVFKSKFFPTGSVMDAKESHRGSYAWHSILGARKVVASGIWWRIGDGSKVKIWGDKWLSDLNMPNLISPCLLHMADYTVSHIIDPTTQSWNVTTV